MELPSWHLLLPVDPGARVLYLGAPGGDTAAGLAETFKTVLVAEPTLERARITRTRADALTRGDVRVVASGGVDLAVRPASVDLAVVEISEQRPGASPGWAFVGYAIEARPLLRAIHSALTSGGVVYLGMPPRASGPRRSRTFSLLSTGRVRRLLTETGFGEIRVWCAYPDCRDPKFLVECEQPVFDWFVRRFAGSRKKGLRAFAQRVFNAAHLLKYTAPGYGVLARRQGARPE